jgi:hypothetical protein
MSNSSYFLTALFLAGVLAWQLVSGKAYPGAYCLVVVMQGAIFLAFLMTGKTWHVR